MTDWIDYYDRDHTIYASRRHREVHFTQVARDIVGYIPSPEAVVLDYACGEALSAPDVAARCGRLILAEPAPSVRERVAARFAGNPKISVVALDDVAARAPASVDLAVMNSVSQYMTHGQLAGAFTAIRSVLKPGGLLVVGDVLRPDGSMLGDAHALLSFGAAHGFFFDALRGLVRTALSDYRAVRNRNGMATFAAENMLTRLRAAGFSAEQSAVNMGHNPRRMTFLARPR